MEELQSGNLVMVWGTGKVYRVVPTFHNDGTEADSERELVAVGDYQDIDIRSDEVDDWFALGDEWREWVSMEADII